jgi:RNA polymerase sigma-70 factor (ECF subfamily)
VRRVDPLAEPEPLIRKVYSYVAYRIGGGPEAEDVSSETIERALRYRSRYDASKGAPGTWLIGIARRCIADRPRPTGVAADLHEQENDDQDTQVDAITVRDAIARLSERDRELVALRYGADLTARQIGELLDLRTNAVEVALHRVHARLRKELADFEPEARKDLGPPAGI